MKNWPRWLKWTVLIQVSLMAFLGPFNPAVINPSLVILAEAFGVDTTEAAYSTNIAIILGGVSVSLHFLNLGETLPYFHSIPLSK